MKTLARDVRANTLGMIAIALMPLLMMAGAAVDTARLYVVKVRLQQACDAGVLAGRKFMTNSSASTLDSNAKLQADNFFNNNFRAGIFGSTGSTFVPVKTIDNQVSATATATVPMTLMKMAGFQPITVEVACEARYDVADLDLMFVLDTTGSMAWAASDTNYSGLSVSSYTRSDGTTGYYTNEKTNSRMKALRSAVLSFYDTLNSAADPSTKIRYGFVPYTSTVNVGKIIPQNFLISGEHTYQSRRPYEANYGSASDTTYTNITQATCNSYAGRTPASGYDSNSRATYRVVQSWTKNSFNNNGTCVIRSQQVQLMWNFGPQTYNVDAYLAGGWVADPSKLDGSTSKWQGCIEERPTTATGSFNQNSLPADLNPDLMPTSNDSRWRPMWPDVVYARNNNLNAVNVTDATAQGSGYYNHGSAARLSTGYVSCGKEAQRLQTMTRAQVAAFVNHNDFRPIGGTYHDTGMIWGVRFISPTGPFAADTATWPNRKEPIRHIIFMTDGEMSPNLDIYGLYGHERSDRRITGTNTSTQLARHNARFLAVCDAAKQRNISVWVIAFGENLDSTMSECASSASHTFEAADDAQLNSAFQSIAARVAMLRISK